MKKKTDNYKLGVSLLISFVYTALLLFVKHYTHNISLSEAGPFYIGNLFNVVPLAIVSASYMFALIRKNKISELSLNTINLLFLSAIIIQLLSFILTYVDIRFYAPFFNYPTRKILLGLFFAMGFSINLFASFTLLYLVLNEQLITPFRAFYMTILTFALYLTISGLTILITSVNGESKMPLQSKGIGVVLGAAVWHNDEPSPLFEARIQKAYELLQLGKISKIQVTGSNAPGELTEAEVAKNLLVSMGVDRSDILLESTTTTTAEQIQFIRENYSNEEGSGIFVISDSFHLRRVIEMSKFFDVEVNGISSNYKLNWRKSIYYYLRESVALLLFWLFAI